MLQGIKKTFTQYRGLPRQIYILLMARTIVAMGSFVHPFLTLFLSTRMGLDEAKIGWFLFAIALVYIPAAMVGGKLADRFSRKWVYFSAMICADIAFVFAGLYCDRFVSVYMIIAGYFFINMAMPVLSAMMMDLTDPSNRQESYSLIYLGFNLGFAFGPLIAGFLFEKYTQWIFWGEAGLNCIAMILIAFLVRDTKPNREEMERISHDESRAAEAATGESLLRSLLRSPVVIFFAVFEACYAFAYSQLGFVLPLQMEDIFGLSDSSRFYGVMWSLNGIFVVLLTPVTVLLLKKKSPLLNLCIAGICIAAGLFANAHITQLIWFYTTVLIWTAGEVVSATNSGVFIANHSPITHRARYQSIYDIIQGAGRAVGPMLMGAYLMRGHGYADVWNLVSLLAIAASGAFFFMYKKEQRRKKAAAEPQ